MTNSWIISFVQPTHGLLRTPSLARPFFTSRNAVPYRGLSVVKRRKPMVMISEPPLPDDTAVDMLTFALSGPGIVAFLALFSIGGFLFLSFAELGSGRMRTSKPFYLRVSLEKARLMEFPDGVVRRINSGESLFRFDSREMCEAVARPLREDGARYTIYRLDGLAVRTLSEWPREINAAGARWPATDNGKDGKELDVWGEYDRIGEMGKIEKQWKNFVNRLGGIIIDNSTSPCRLCGGSGYTRCFRCGGVGTSRNANFICDCQSGRRPCEWCSQSQQQT